MTAADNFTATALAALDAMSDDVSAPVAVRGDARDGRVYLASPEVITALKVAIITGRPLLIRGPAGSGKSSLASYVARNLGAAYYEFVANDDSVASDLLWRFDAVRRLSDAQSEHTTIESGVAGVAPYVDPGPLWWSLNPRSAETRGLGAERAAELGLAPLAKPDLLGKRETEGAVLLIDEIDKADAAFCNGLLVPLGSRQFAVPPLRDTVRWEDDSARWSPLIIITTNDERDLPAAFLRRCLTLRIEAADSDRLVEIAVRQFGAERISGELLEVVRELADRVSAQAGHAGLAASVAEFNDLVTVLLSIEDRDFDGDQWRIIRSLMTNKTQDGRNFSRRWSR